MFYIYSRSLFRSNVSSMMTRMKKFNMALGSFTPKQHLAMAA